MAHADFLKIEHERDGDLRIHLVHTTQPRFLVEFEPVYDKRGSLTAGRVKRTCFENSPVAGYTHCGRWVSRAERFLANAIRMEALGSAGASGARM